MPHWFLPLSGLSRAGAPLRVLYWGAGIVVCVAIYCSTARSFAVTPLQSAAKVDSLLRELRRAPEAQDTNRAALLNELAYRYWQFKPDSGAVFAREAYRIARLTGQTSGAAEALENMGRIYNTLGRYDSAEVAYRRALGLWRSLGDRIGEASCLNSVGVVYRLQGKYVESVALYKEALTRIEAKGDSVFALRAQKMRAKLMNNIAMVYRLQGKHGEALPHLKEALGIVERLGDSSSAAGFKKNIGLLYEADERFNEALLWHKEGLESYRRLEDKQGVAASLDNIGAVEQKLGILDSAAERHERALALFEEIGNAQGVGWSLYHLAKVAWLQRKYARAEEYHRRALALRESLGDKQTVAASRIGIAETFVSAGRFAEAAAYYESAGTLAESIGALADAQDAYAGAASVYETMSKPQKALAYYKKFLAVRDSLRAETNAKAFAELQAERDYERQKARIALLEGERQRQEAGIREQRLFTRFALAAGALAFAVAGFAIYGYRVKVRSANELQRRNDEILRQQELLERQAADIEITNTRLQETNAKLLDANEELRGAYAEILRQQEIVERQSADIQEANTRLQESNLALQQLNAEKNEFLGIVAHDLKNPIGSIVVNASALQRYALSVTPEQVTTLSGRIIEVSSRMKHIIEDLLDINALDSGKMNINPTRLDMSELVCELAEQYRPAAEAKLLSLSTEILSSDAVVSADAGKVAEILDNLLSNAIKYSPHGTNVTVRLNSSEKAVRVEVQDEGQGVSEEDRKKLFGKFARLSAKPTGGEHSTGLGLHIVKKLSEALQGRVWCESELGRGATFIVELPRFFVS